MSKKIDIEVLLDNLKTFLQANLNNKITEINTEKNDAITLRSIDNGAYILQSMDEFPVNFDPILFYGLDSVTGQAVHGAIAKDVKIEVTVIIADPSDSTLFARLFRYQRALEEIFTDSPFKLGNVIEKIKIESLEPIAFKVQNSTSEFKAIGVIIQLDLFS